ncbi:MAG: M3 family metallopeptidase [Patescibacteria group bacterium]
MKKTQKLLKKSSKKQNSSQWNLGLLYSSPKDPQIEKDVVQFEAMCTAFAEKYDNKEKAYLINQDALLSALQDYLLLVAKSAARPELYFYFLSDIESTNTFATAQLSLLSNRLQKAVNTIRFFELSLGNIPEDVQEKIMADTRLSEFKIFLARIFSDARYKLSLPEEKIMSLKELPSYNLWISGNEKLLSSISVEWKKKKLPLSQAIYLIPSVVKDSERNSLSKLVATTLKNNAAFAESEINAVVTDKKINDELRGYTTPYQETVLKYRNDPVVVENLVTTVTDAFPLAHRFFKLKAGLFKTKKLSYGDRGVDMAGVKGKYSLGDSIAKLKKTFGSVDKKYANILDSYIEKGQIDVFPRMGKTGGAYCAGTYGNPTFVLLNHVDTFQSFTTFAHEMGHAFHTELSESQGPIYSNYSTSLAETASTLFEALAFEEEVSKLPESVRINVLHNKISDDMQTIFRQIACFNFEKDIHTNIRSKGFLSKEELAGLHNLHMKSYLGPAFSLASEDGYYFVMWTHIRRFFYVYSYAYGLLVSKALLRRYKKDPSFWSSIEKFLSSGGRGSPEEILEGIGINISSPDFFREGIEAIKEDVDTLEKLMRVSKKKKGTKK